MEALRNMERTDHRNNPVPFSVQFVTADLSKKTGGEIIDLKGVVLPWAQKKKNKSTSQEPRNANSQGKKPGHYKNRTRNFLLPNGEIRKAHISLITKFNEQVVL